MLSSVLSQLLIAASIGAILPDPDYPQVYMLHFLIRISAAIGAMFFSFWILNVAGIDAICGEALTRERSTVGRSERPLLIDFLHIFLYFAHVYDYVYVYRLLAGTVTTKNSLVVVPSFAVVF